MDIRTEAENHLKETLIPFWAGLKDEKYGGFCGYVDHDLNADRDAEKGCILMSRIIWFFANAFLVLGDRRLLELSGHGYEFLAAHCFDKDAGGVYWSVLCDGTPADTTKHTYNQAFTIYALSSYYKASGDAEALRKAVAIFRLIEDKMKDGGGYLEAFDRYFRPASNEKLSENGVMAVRTMNTHLHVMEAYTELLDAVMTENENEAVCGKADRKEIRKALLFVCQIFLSRMWNPGAKRVEVFFDHEWNSLIDLWSSGHDIESSWLCDRAADVLTAASETEEELREVQDLAERIHGATAVMAEQVLDKACRRNSVISEFEKGKPSAGRIWWVQAEAVVGFLNAYGKNPEQVRYREAAEDIWEFIKTFFVDRREGSEWFWDLDEDMKPTRKPIVEPWKCPYHNGRMCFEAIRRLAS